MIYKTLIRKKQHLPDINQENERLTEVRHEDIAEVKKDDSTNEEVSEKDNKPIEEIECKTVDRGEQIPKKGGVSRLFGN
ncbi:MULTISPECIES: hypothetical protein [Staphylococcus]|uniref:Uncharacterized protein n=1 Tax=Staphylococcus sp. 693-2 TaxID=373067 RepID=Q0ZKI5_9STAP|nr:MULTISPECIES: hypothetical protein [Staphylococcus]ABG49289.1 hypothetical protein [Staphylococcus sp. 693-2]